VGETRGIAVSAILAQIEGVIFGADDRLVPPTAGLCPSGFFAVGAGSVSVSGAHGYLESVNVTCCSLRFSEPKSADSLLVPPIS
jgi:hypothetical protein